MKKALIAIFILSSSSLAAQNRLGVVDIAVDPILVDERASLVDDLRRALAARSSFEVLRKEEVETDLRLLNPLDEKEADLVASHENYLVDVLRELDAAKSLYRSSDFGKMITTLNSVFPNLDSAAIAIEETQVKEIISLLAVAEYFLGRRGRSDALLTALFEFDPAHVFSSNVYPPGVISRFNQIRSQRSPARVRLLLKSRESDFKVSFLGKDLELEVENGVPFVKVPLENEILNSFSLVVQKEGYATQIFPVSDIPDRIRFQPLGSRPLETKGVFDVLNSLSASAALKDVMKEVGADVFLLAHATKDLTNVWVIRAQWINKTASRRSPVMKAENLERTLAIELSVEQLLGFLGPDGEIISDLGSWALGDPKNEYQSEKPAEAFYKKWWFWTLVGVAGAGAGVGTYFLVKPEDKTRFVVEPAN